MKLFFFLLTYMFLSLSPRKSIFLYSRMPVKLKYIFVLRKYLQQRDNWVEYNVFDCSLRTQNTLTSIHFPKGENANCKDKYSFETETVETNCN